MKTYKNASKSLLASVCVLALLTLLLSSCLKDNNNYYNPPVALVTFIQASPDEPPLDFYLNNNLVNFGAVNYGDHIDYFSAYAGARTANFYNSGTMTKILSGNIQLNQNTTYSLFLANKASQPEIVLLKDSISKPASGNANIRFVDLSPDAPAVDLAVQGGAVLVANKSYKGFSLFSAIPAKTGYTFEVRQAGTNTVLATLANVDLNAGHVYTIWFHGLAAGTTATDKLAVDILTNAFYY